MVNSPGIQRNTSRHRPYGWLGAGALTLGVGVALAGAGAAHADDTSTTAATSSARTSAAAASTPGATAAKSSRPSRVARPVRDSASKSSANVSERSATVLSRQPEAASTVAARSRRLGVASYVPTPTAAATLDELPTAYRAPEAAAATVAAGPNGVVTPAPSQATIAVTNWFASTRSALYQFDGPLAEALQNTLTAVQRTLFSPAPTVKPMQYTSWTPGDPILGALESIQPGGAAVSMQLTQAPALGTVQLLSDGAYTYAPGADFAGTDTFTAEVTSAGFNILEPFTPRTASVTVNIVPAPLTQLTRGYDITNLSGASVYVAQIQKEPGYEDSVEAGSVGTVLRPGDTYHVELTKWAFYSYITSFDMEACSDISCATFQQSGDSWTVRLSQSLLTDYSARCYGFCVNGSGQNIGWSSDGFNALSNTVVRMVDPPGTVKTLSAGTEADKIARVLDQLCTSNSSASCSFSPKTFQQTQTPWILAQSFTNNTNVQVTQALARNQTTSTQTSLKVSQSAKLNLFKIVEAGVNRETTQTWTTQTTWQETYTVPIPPGETGYLYYRDPIKRVTGDFTATIGNTTWNLTDVNFDTPDPDNTRQDGGRAVYQATNTPVTPGI